MVDDKYGRYFRSSFKDTRGTSELAMLAAPSKDEIDQLKKAVAIMTPAEKQNAGTLTDEQVHKIASDAGIDAGILAIFLNGYALELKRVSQVHRARGEN
jgi:signal recognition particle GTPase